MNSVATLGAAVHASSVTEVQSGSLLLAAPIALVADASTHGATVGIPFVVAGLAFHRSMAAFAVVKRHYRALMVVGGGLLVAIGALEITGLWSSAVQQLQTLFPGGTVL